MKFSIFFCLIWNTAFASEPRSLVENGSTNNQALVIGVYHGLPGQKPDLDAVDSMVKIPSYQFQKTQILDQKAPASVVLKSLTETAAKVPAKGTFLFWFGGHGNSGVILAQDRTISVKELRGAIEKGREGAGPLERLILLFDSCYSGSLLKPFGFDFGQPSSEAIADSIVDAFAPSERAESYWNKLFVFASSRADESSLSGSGGSNFTMGLKKAFDEVMASDGTIRDLVSGAKKYTKVHHPVERIVPEELGLEKLRP